MRERKKRSFTINILLLIALCVIILAPFYVAICYAFKSRTEFVKTKLAFPTSLYFREFLEAVGIPHYFTAFRNSVIVAVCMVVCIIFILLQELTLLHEEITNFIICFIMCFS